jgi:hypothetical protein
MGNAEKIFKGEAVKLLSVGFIIDCPWLPNWYGIKILDYFSNDESWLNANLKALKEFPDVMFFPGFWSEFGLGNFQYSGAKNEKSRNLRKVVLTAFYTFWF